MAANDVHRVGWDEHLRVPLSAAHLGDVLLNAQKTERIVAWTVKVENAGREEGAL